MPYDEDLFDEFYCEEGGEYIPTGAVQPPRHRTPEYVEDQYIDLMYEDRYDYGVYAPGW